MWSWWWTFLIYSLHLSYDPLILFCYMKFGKPSLDIFKLFLQKQISCYYNIVCIQNDQWQSMILIMFSDSSSSFCHPVIFEFITRWWHHRISSMLNLFLESINRNNCYVFLKQLYILTVLMWLFEHCWSFLIYKKLFLSLLPFKIYLIARGFFFVLGIISVPAAIRIPKMGESTYSKALDAKVKGKLAWFSHFH